MLKEQEQQVWENINKISDNDFGYDKYIVNENFTPSDDKFIISDDDDIHSIISNLDIFVYKDILAPEIQKNEDIKRKHKEKLLKLISKIIYINFFTIIISVVFIFIGIMFFDKIDIEFCKELLSFLKFFLSALFTEFISILFFIVHNVFDKSIFNLFSSFGNKKK